jgi:hypothetical protein
MFSEPCYPSKCCVDCLMYLANGETDPNASEEETNDFLERFRKGTAGYEVTLGKLAEYHDCKTNYTVVTTAGEYETYADSEDDVRDNHIFRAHYPPDLRDEAEIVSITKHELEIADDCECEQEGFSWSSCDVCGSPLGGDRFAVTFWIPEAKDAK